MLMRRIEKFCGLRRIGRYKVPFTERFNQCREHIITANEARYQLKTDPSFSFEQRIDLVVNAALESAERIGGVNVNANEDFFFRMHRMRQLYWDRTILPGVDTLDDRTRIERSTLDLQAGEAWYIGRHLELVDLGCCFRGPLPPDNAPLHEKIEYAQNLWDFANRTMGGAFKDRVSIFPRKVIIRAAPPINLTERLPEYKQNRKDAVETAMNDLEKAFLDCINDVNKKIKNREGRKRNKELNQT
jgi:hypothetical protein